MTDPFVEAAAHIIDRAVEDFRAAIDGAAVEALNWRPAGDDTNSIAVLTVHSMHSTRSWLSVATGAPLPARDRPSEFVATTAGAKALLELLREFALDSGRLLETSEVPDWGVLRATHARPNAGDADEVSAAWALLHALEHLREHAGQVLLTRQLWDRAEGA